MTLSLSSLAGNPMVVAAVIVFLAITLDALLGYAVSIRLPGTSFNWGKAGQYLWTHVAPQFGGLVLAFVANLGANATNVVVLPQAAAAAFWVAIAAIGKPILADLLTKAEALISGQAPSSSGAPAPTVTPPD